MSEYKEHQDHFKMPVVPLDPSDRDFVMDPDGDAIITLNNPNAPFAASIGPSETSACSAPGDPISEPKGATPYTFLVSSRHLILASPVFKKMLTGSGWSEANKIDGQFRIDTSEWDSRAFSIVLNLVHGRHRRTPKSVTLETLSRIAAIVDYYEFHETVEVSVNSWVLALLDSEPVSEKLERKLFLWMFNAWVFGLDDIFRSTTKAAILRTTSDLETTDDFPIPSKVIDRINEVRQAAITSIVSGLAKLREDYAQEREGCNLVCAFVHLGALMKLSVQIDAAGCPPCAGKSLTEVVHSIRGMKLPNWVSSDDGKRGLYGYKHGRFPNWHKCHTEVGQPWVDTLQVQGFGVGFDDEGNSGWESSQVLPESLAPITRRAETEMMGLSLHDFARSING